MLQEGNASRERLNEFNDIIYCLILYIICSFDGKLNIMYGYFKLAVPGREGQTIYPRTMILYRLT